jgi:hypothetical protein
MKINKIDDLLKLDSLFLYCHKTQQYEEVNKINEISTIRNNLITYIKGSDIYNNPLYNQFQTTLYEQLKNKFKIIKQWEQNQ